jgi:hypothetical protein
MNTETKTESIEIKAFSNAEKISFNVLDKLNISGMSDFKLTQLVVFETLRQLDKNELLKHDLKQYFN